MKAEISVALPGEPVQQKGPGPGAALQDTGQKDTLPVTCSFQDKNTVGHCKFLNLLLMFKNIGGLKARK